MLAKTLLKLIAFKTVTGNYLENEKAIAWIKTQLKTVPVYITDYKKNNFSSLLITTQKTKKPKLWLQAHLDVVDGSEKTFQPKLQNNCIYGRGVFDMKFAIACYLKLFQELGKRLPQYSTGIMITTDEEIGGHNGVKALLSSGYSSDLCILPDGGKNFALEVSAKGVWHLLIESQGKSGHASRPWSGKNSIEELIDFLFIIKKQFPKEPCCTKDHIHDTFNIGKIKGGESTNQIPNYASAMIDIRIASASSKPRLEKIFQAILKNYKGITIKEISFGNNYSIDIKNNYIKAFSKIVYDQLKIKQKFIHSHGSSDARFFLDKGIQTILTRPRGGGHHSENEWVDMNSLEQFYIVLKKFVEINMKI